MLREKLRELVKSETGRWVEENEHFSMKGSDFLDLLEIITGSCAVKNHILELADRERPNWLLKDEFIVAIGYWKFNRIDGVKYLIGIARQKTGSSCGLKWAKDFLEYHSKQ